MTTDDPGRDPILVLTADEIGAIARLHHPGFPPGVGPDDVDDHLAASGVRSLVARSLLSDDAALAPELAIVLATYHAATHRANILVADGGGERQSTLHVGPELGVTHMGRPEGVHSFALVEPAVWSTEGLTEMLLGDGPDPTAGEPPIDPIAAATRSAVANVVVREGVSYAGTEVVVVWADDGAWILGLGSAVAATRATVADRLGQLQPLASTP